jgi:hypothetical protein
MSAIGSASAAYWGADAKAAQPKVVVVTFRRRLEFDSINEANEFLEFLEVADRREHRSARIEE